jgi:hypothetical protein
MQILTAIQWICALFLALFGLSTGAVQLPVVCTVRVTDRRLDSPSYRPSYSLPHVVASTYCCDLRHRGTFGMVCTVSVLRMNIVNGIIDIFV